MENNKQKEKNAECFRIMANYEREYEFTHHVSAERSCSVLSSVSHATLQAQHFHVGSERKHKSFPLHGKHFIEIALSPLRDHCSTKVHTVVV